MNPAELFRHEKETLNLAPGDVLFSVGDSGKDMYVVIEGALEVRVGDKVVESAIPGAMVGEMALIDEATRTATVVATAPSKLVPINLRRFHFLIQQNPFFASHVMKVMVERLRRMNQRLNTLSAAGFEEPN
jgi:CRP/FNR family transcriptional regulator, cyclic AMP receptor protein